LRISLVAPEMIPLAGPESLWERMLAKHNVVARAARVLRLAEIERQGVPLSPPARHDLVTGIALLEEYFVDLDFEVDFANVFASGDRVRDLRDLRLRAGLLRATLRGKMPSVGKMDFAFALDDLKRRLCTDDRYVKRRRTSV